MSRRSRERRDERRATPAAPVAVARPPAQRGTFRVAQAQRTLAAELPGIVRNRSAERRLDQGASPSRITPTTSGQVAAQRKPSRDAARQQPRQLDLKKLESCKPKPSGKAKGGAGTGRAFVPWCS